MVYPLISLDIAQSRCENIFREKTDSEETDMRTAVLLASFVLFIQTAFAEEVALEMRTIDADSPLGAVKAKDMQFESAEKPDGAKVPEGDLAWGRLTLGGYNYMLCISKKKDKLTKLYQDGDGDKDFK